MFRQDRTNPSTAVSNWRGRHDTPKAWPSTAVSSWLNGGLFGAAGMTAFGGIITQYEDSGTTYRVHTFRGSGTFYVSDGAADVSYVIIGGGGAGGGTSGSWVGGGGGGAGELASGTAAVSAGTYTITVGEGGAGDTNAGASGASSSAFSVTAIGGGGGGHASAGVNGGCGGGAGQNAGAASSFAGGTASGSHTGFAGGLSRNYTTNGGWYESGGGGGTGAVGEDSGTDGNLPKAVTAVSGFPLWVQLLQQPNTPAVVGDQVRVVVEHTPTTPTAEAKAELSVVRLVEKSTRVVGVEVYSHRAVRLVPPMVVRVSSSSDTRWPHNG